MLYRTNTVLEPITCSIQFQNAERLVLLKFEADAGSLYVRIPEYVMADLTGRFVRERLFGLH